jgi:hypothetical protein
LIRLIYSDKRNNKTDKRTDGQVEGKSAFMTIHSKSVLFFTIYLFIGWALFHSNTVTVFKGDTGEFFVYSFLIFHS